jgi:signal transduction histidine kinase
MKHHSSTPEVPDHCSISQVLRYIEWVLLGVATLIVTISGFNDFHAPPFDTYVTLLSLSACALLSFLFPVNRPLWQRQLYILLEFLTILPSRLLTDWDLSIFLYLFIAKSCFLLKRRTVLFIVVAMAIVWQSSRVFGFWLQLPEKMEFYRTQSVNYLTHPERIIAAMVVNDTGLYIAASTFVLLLCTTVIAERRSRQKAEQLSQQVEALTITLERTRIARNIHDSLGHSLTDLDSQLAVIQHQLKQHQVEQATQAVEMAQLLSQQCIEDVSQALQTLRQPSVFDLNQALLNLVEQVRHHQTLQVRWEVHLPQLPLEISHQIYLIIKEGLMNIQKHAHASQIQLRGQLIEKEIILELEDNGQGFDPESTPYRFGLQGIRERVHLLRGRLTIRSNLGMGTQIHITIPQ